MVQPSQAVVADDVFTPHHERLSAIRALPQAAHISDQRAVAWLERTEALEPGRLDWHINRLRGFGGSEIGHLLTAFRGEFDPFASARDLCATKLCLQAPDGGSPDTRRGTAVEPLTRGIFLQKFRARRRTDLLERFIDYRHRRHPWLGVNPDDIVTLPNNRTYLLDYKSPGAQALAALQRAGEVPSNYAAQLQAGELVAIDLGIKIDGLLLVNLDMENWDVDVRQFESSSALAAEIIEAGHHYWNNHVMRGLLPEIIVKPSFDVGALRPELRDHIEKLSVEFAAVRSLAKVAEERSMETVAALTHALSGVTLGGMNLKLPGAMVAPTTVLDRTAIVANCERHGIAIDTEALATAADTELKRLHAQLAEKGIDTSACSSERHSVRVRMDKVGPAFELLERNREVAAPVVSGFAAARLADMSRPNLVPTAPPQLSAQTRKRPSA